MRYFNKSNWICGAYAPHSYFKYVSYIYYYYDINTKVGIKIQKGVDKMSPELMFLKYLKEHDGTIPVPKEGSINKKTREYSKELLRELNKIQEIETCNRAMGY